MLEQNPSEALWSGFDLLSNHTIAAFMVILQIIYDLQAILGHYHALDLEILREG
jgi:hypothetical protein